MTVYDLGIYRIQQLSHGFKVSWDDKGIRHHLMLNVEHLIKNHIEEHLCNLQHVIYLFEKGPDAFLTDDMCLKIIGAMPHTDTIPGKHILEHEITEWHHRQLVIGYNRVFNTELTYEMVRNRL